MSSQVKKDFVVCIKQGCLFNPCMDSSDLIPKSCPYGILHSLGEPSTAICPKPRRSGKTTKLVEVANALADQGKKVVFVVTNGRTRDWIESLYKFRKGISVISMRQLVQMRGMDNVYVVADEISDKDMIDLNEMIVACRGVLVARFWTP